MPESIVQNFNHLKIHSQYSICEGAIKIEELTDISKQNKINSLALCDSPHITGIIGVSDTPVSNPID